jgi:hypothetical protein
MTASDVRKVRAAIEAFITPMFWPFVWAAAQVRALADYLRKQIESFKS